MAMIRRWLQGIRTSFWLGWQVESNWTDPFLFAIYTVVRPLTGGSAGRCWISSS
jgi:hypothetical protein